MCSADFKLDYLRPAFLQSMGKIFMPDDPYLMEI